MYLNEKYFYHVAQSDYQAIMKSVKQGNICDVKLPCGHTVSVKHNDVYYRWWTVKSNAPTGPDGKFIETVDLISFCLAGETSRIPYSVWPSTVRMCTVDFWPAIQEISKLFDHAAHNGANYLNGIYTIKPDSFLVGEYTKGANL